MLVDLIGHDAAAAHLNDAVGHTGQCRVVGNNNDGASGLAAGILQKAQHLLASEICRDPLDPAETLRSVGLGERLNNFPAQLSGGEQQRVSIARALAKNPKLLLCDEPTGALDYKTGKQVLALLQDTCRRTGRTVIVITHNTALTAMADRIIQVRSGKIVSNQVNEHPVPVQEIEW